MRYGWGALMINQFDGTDAMVGTEHVLDYYGLAGESCWLFLLYESLFLLGFTFFTWLALHRKYAHR